MTTHRRSAQKTPTNIGKWAAWYQGLEGPWPCRETTSYEIGAAWLAVCARTEDWGCGAGWLRTLIPPDRYQGLDGTASPFCDRVVDLVSYRSRTPGVFMRHVLEHNYEWARILENAVASFTEQMVLILFTPELAATETIVFRPDIGVPDIAFRLVDISDRFPLDVPYTVPRIPSATQYGRETILLLERHPGGHDRRADPGVLSHTPPHVVLTQESCHHPSKSTLRLLENAHSPDASVDIGHILSAVPGSAG